MNKIQRYRPACFSGYEDEHASFNSLDELMKIEWIASWKDHTDFYQFSISREQWLMCEVKGGTEWWVIGYFHEVYNEVAIWFPKWIPKDKGGNK
jgi:hypothetical protein